MKYLIPLLAPIVLASCNNKPKQEKEEPIVWDTTAAFFIDSAVVRDNTFSPDMSTIDSNEDLTVFSLLPGEHFTFSISDEVKNANWYTLTDSNGQQTLEQNTPTFDKAFDNEVYDTLYNVSGDRASEIHLANIPNIQTGLIETVELDTNVVKVGENVFFDYKGTHYRVYASGYKARDMGVANYRLNIEAQKDGVTTKQVLFASPYYETYHGCVFELLGDIDGDDKLDVIIKDKEFDSLTIMVYLSGGAEQGKLLKLCSVNIAADPFEQGC